jgi:hypothetical protein
MSTPGPTPNNYPPSSVPSGGPVSRASEIKLISHSNLFYWWPVWVFAFFMAGWTYFENNRLAIVPAGSTFAQMKDKNPDGAEAPAPGRYTLTYDAGKHRELDASLNDQSGSAALSAAKNEPFPMRVSRHPSMGVFFLVVLMLTVVVTNVPLRGLWAFMVLLTIALVSVIITLIPGAWDKIFESIAGLRIHINMAGYFFIGVATVVLWALAVFVFDRRAYVIFTPGQIKVCEHIGAAVEAFPTMGVVLTKQRDDLFRHYIFGFGSGDLILKFQTGDRRELRIPNVLGIGWQLKAVEDMLRTLPSSTV